MRGTKDKCRSCDTRLERQPGFCPKCGEPTRWATAEQRTQYDLEKWRQHSNRARTAPAREVRIPASVAAATDPTAPVVIPNEDVHIVKRRSRPEATRKIALPAIKRPRPEFFKRAPKAEPAQPEVIDLDGDNPFAYSACVSCHKTDWIVRTGKNEDDSFRYWCLRCSRAFKSDTRLPHARLPFVVAGSILSVLVILTNLP